MNFAEKLRKITVKKDAKFVDYRPETGSWVFKVDHFSKYGFNDSDEESEAAGQEGAAAKKPLEAVPKKDGQDQQMKADASKKIVPPKDQIQLGIEDEIFIDDNEQYPDEEDMLHHSMYVDDISDEEYRTIPVHIPYDPFKTSKSIQIMKSTLFAEDDRSSDGGGSHVSIIRQYLDLPDEDIPRLPLIREVMPKKRVTLRPKLDKILRPRGMCVMISRRCWCIVSQRC